MKKFKYTILLMLLASLLFIGCGGQKDEKVEPLKIGLLRIDDSLPFYVAEQEGLFDKYDVAVELIAFSSGKDQSIALESGELDGLMTDMVVQGLLRKSGVDVKTVAMALGATAEEGRFLVVAAPDSDIRTPADLNGRRVAIANNTMMDYLVEMLSTYTQVDYASLELVNMPDLMLRVTTLLEGRDIEAAILPDPLAAYAVQAGAHIVIDDTAVGENLSQSVVAMTGETLTNRQQEVQKMLSAYNEAIALLNANPEDYRQLCVQTARVPEELAEDYPIPRYTPNCVPDEAAVARIVDWLVKRQLIEAPYCYADMVDKTFCHE